LDGEEGSGMEDGGEEGEGGDAGTEDETEEGRGRRGGGHGQEDSFIETLITRRRVSLLCLILLEQAKHPLILIVD
jgi:hypothetical protein